MLNSNRAELLRWLNHIARRQLRKLGPNDIQVSTRVTNIIAKFVFKAAQDLIKRANKYRSEREEEESSEEEENIEEEDVIKAYRDLGDRYVLTGEDNDNLFSRIALSNEESVSAHQRVLHMTDLLVTYDLPVTFSDESVRYFIYVYIKLLSRELLEESAALLDPQSKIIRVEDAINAVRMRKEAIID